MLRRRTSGPALRIDGLARTAGEGGPPERMSRLAVEPPCPQSGCAGIAPICWSRVSTSR